MDEFQENILEHYKHPHNFGKPDWVPTHSAQLQNLSCGDEVTFYLQVENGIVLKARFTGEGCSIALASASMFSDYLIGKKVFELKMLDENFTETSLLHITLTPSRFKCSTLAQETVCEALKKI